MHWKIFFISKIKEMKVLAITNNHRHWLLKLYEDATSTKWEMESSY